MHPRWSLIHALVFNLLWFVVVFAVAAPGGEPLALASLLTFCILFVFVGARVGAILHPQRELLFMAALMLVGFAFDSILLGLGRVAFPLSEYLIVGYPVWMLGMWGAFATSFSTSMRWILHRPVLQILFGGIGGPMSLYAASKIGALIFPLGAASVLPLVSIEWIIAMVVACGLHRRLVGVQTL